MKKSIAILVFIFLSCAVLNAWASVPDDMRFQGVLTDSAGDMLEGEYVITFSLYDSAEGSGLVWSEAINATVNNGLVDVVLGESSGGLDENLFDGSDLWLGIKVGDDIEMTPRQKISSVPYAIRANKAESAASADNVPSGAEIVATVDGAGFLTADDLTDYVTVLFLEGNYYDSQAIDNLLEAYAASDHNHDGLYAFEDHAHNWTDIDGLPESACLDGQVLKYDDSTAAWICEEDFDNDTLYSAAANMGIELDGNAFKLFSGCTSNQVLKWNGSQWICATHFSGDVTAVSAGTGLSGGGDTGNVSLSADTSYLQRRISNSCPEGSSIRQIGSDGSIICEADDDTLRAMSCPVGQVPKYNGSSWVCANDEDTDTTYTAGRGLELSGTTFNIKTCATGQVLAWSGSDWSCVTPSNGDITEVGAGIGLTGGGNVGSVTLNVSFAGDGTSYQAAHSDHTHSGMVQYAKIMHVSPSGVPIADGTILRNTVQGVSASAANRWLVLVEPGIYDLGANGIQVPAYVDLAGYGSSVTFIKTDRSGTGSGAIITSSNSVIRDLTIENKHSNQSDNYYCTGVSVSSGVWAKLKDVKIDCYCKFARGIYTVLGGYLELKDVEIVADASNIAYGVEFAGSELTVDGLEVTSKSAAITIGIRLNGNSIYAELNDVSLNNNALSSGASYCLSAESGAHLVASNVKAVANGGNTVVGYRLASNVNASLYSCRSEVYNGAGSSYGIWVDQAANVLIENSNVLAKTANNCIGLVASLASVVNLRNTSIVADGGSSVRAVYHNQTNKTEFDNCHLEAKNGTSNSRAIDSSAGNLYVNNSRLIGSTNTVYAHNGTQVRLFSNVLDGGSVSGTTVTCAANTDENYTFYQSTCP